jgi:sporulation protein YlmC with PRC-barrel domain
MKRATLAGSVMACLCLGLATPLLAAQDSATGTTNHPSQSEKSASATKPAEKCLTDLRAFDRQMEKDGYWLAGSGYGYGYPMGESSYGYGGPMGSYPAQNVNGYRNARPGYEVRMLTASANILAQHGQQQACEEVLATTRDIYKLYIADMHSGRVPVRDMAAWRQQQIATAQPVTTNNTSFRSDELVGIDVRNPQGEALGSVDDLVMSPKTGKIAYLVIGRGGIFGIDEKYVPVPWEKFKVTPNVNLLVLDTTKAAMDAAPQMIKDQFATSGHFDQQSEKVDAYWKTHLSSKGNN